MRLFVAIELSAASRRELKRRLYPLREQLPGARWVAPDILHLTLLFLGETDPAQVPALTAALAEAFDRPSFDLRVAGGGTFPPERPARVAWVGVEDWGTEGELAALQQAVTEAAIAGAGFVPEKRPFTPHVTVARTDNWPRDAAQKFAAAFPGEVGPPFPVERGLLYESKLSSAGARYFQVAEFPLRPPAEPGDEP